MPPDRPTDEHASALSAAEVDRRALLDALAWQLEAGCDEAIEETPVRLLAAEGEVVVDQPSPQTATPPPRSAPAGASAAPTASAAKRKTGSAERRPPSASNDPDAAAARDAARLAAGAESLTALKAALESFEGSPLKAGARTTVFADGNPEAWTMVVGEAPGRDEDRVGKPFVGRSGQLLDRMLAAIGLDRHAEDPPKAVYIANVVPYRPLQNRAPNDLEVQALLPFIRRQIALARPRAVLCLGNVPAKHLMGATAGITRFRGTWTELEVDGAAIPALASFHPAYLLRSAEQKRYAWRDLLEFEERLARAATKQEPR